MLGHDLGGRNRRRVGGFTPIMRGNILLLGRERKKKWFEEVRASISLSGVSILRTKRANS